MITVKIKTESLAALISGVYIMSHEADPAAIPSWAWLNIAQALTPYLTTWDYEVQSIESWVEHSLLITPLEVLTVKDFDLIKNYKIYVEIPNGNTTLIATGDIVWEDSTNTSSQLEKNMES